MDTIEMGAYIIEAELLKRGLVYMTFPQGGRFSSWRCVGYLHNGRLKVSSVGKYGMNIASVPVKSIHEGTVWLSGWMEKNNIKFGIDPKRGEVHLPMELTGESWMN